MAPQKLVRDLVPDIIRRKGALPQIRNATEEELPGLLAAKLQEETEEFLSATSFDELTDELADVLEVVYALAENLGIGRDGLEAQRLLRRQERGGFDQGFVWTGNLTAYDRSSFNRR